MSLPGQGTCTESPESCQCCVASDKRLVEVGFGVGIPGQQEETVNSWLSGNEGGCRKTAEFSTSCLLNE